jgi:hypothetical protein
MLWSGLQVRLYILEGSTNLVDWEKIGVAVDRGEGISGFEDANAAPAKLLLPAEAPLSASQFHSRVRLLEG